MSNIISIKKMHSGFLSGAKEVMNNKKILNKINVFPVADGDTGNNLFSTMNSIIMDSKISDCVKNTMKSIADASLMGARGNSGIIFAQYINGLSIEIGHETDLTMENFSKACKNAVKYAYDSISNPVEGTMITIIKDWSDAMFDFHKKAKNFEELFTHAHDKIEQSLINTKNQLSVLKKASVVDSGAKGFVLFIKGFLDFLKKSEETFELESLESIQEEIIIEEPIYSHQDIKFRYCTEGLIIGKELESNKVKEALINLGDSLIIAGNDRKIRVHVHTDNPHLVFEELSSFGRIEYQKADDMQKQNDIVINKKYKIALVTDTMADLPKEYVDENQIQVANLNIIVNDINYIDKLTISNEKILELYEDEKNTLSTAQPDIKTVDTIFSFLSSYYDEIIAITISKELSGTNSVFNKVADKYRKDGKKITVLNSKQNSGTEGLLVMKCAEKIKAGKPYDEIVNEMNAHIDNSKILIRVKTLENLIRIGRLSTKAGVIANFFNLKPIATVDKEGKVAIEGIGIGNKSSFNKIVKHIKRVMKSKNILGYSIVHINNQEEANEYFNILQNIIGKKADYVDDTSSATVIGVGDGGIGISYITN